MRRITRIRRFTGIHTLDGGVAADVVSFSGAIFMGDVNFTVVGGRSTAVVAGAAAGMDGGKAKLDGQAGRPVHLVMTASI